MLTQIKQIIDKKSFLFKNSALAFAYAILWFVAAATVTKGRGLDVVQMLLSLGLSFLIFFILNGIFYSFNYQKWGVIGKVFITIGFISPLFQILYYLTYKIGLDLQVLSVVIREPAFLANTFWAELSLGRAALLVALYVLVFGVNSFVLNDRRLQHVARGPYFYFKSVFTWIFIAIMIWLQVRWCLDYDDTQLTIRPMYPVMVVVLLSVFHFLLTARSPRSSRAIVSSAILMLTGLLYVLNLSFFSLKEKISLVPSYYVNVFGAYFVQASIGDMKQTNEAYQKFHQLEPAKLDYNVLVILNDSQRWDHLSANGFPKNTTGELDWLIKKSYNFQFPIAPANFTDTAVPALFYGMGSDQDVRKIKSNLVFWDFFAKSAETFFMSSVSVKWSKIDWMLASVGQKHLWSLPLHSPEMRKGPLYDDQVASQQVSKYIKSIKGPYVGVWQANSSHHDYRTPPENQFYKPCDITRASGLEAFRNCYLNGTLYGFHLYNEVIQQLDLEKTIIIITSDHAEGMGEHGIWFHGEGYNQEIVKVPFIFYIPDALKKRLPVENLQAMQENTKKVMSTLDMVPTLLRLHELMTGQKLYSNLEDFSGKSLLDRWDNRVVFSSHCFPQYRCYSREIVLADDNYYAIFNPAAGFNGIYDTWKDLNQQKPLTFAELNQEKFQKFLKAASLAHPLGSNIETYAQKGIKYTEHKDGH